MLRALALGGALALGATGPAHAQPLPLSVERYRLPSGLTVLLHPDHRAPTVAVNLYLPVGSADEPAGRTGFAHLFEHLMFMGTRRVPPGELDRLVEDGGGTANASTSEDATSYLDSGPSNLLPTFLYLEADRLDALADAMTDAKLALQRDVVENERAKAYDNRPYGGAELRLPEALFPPGHPYHHPVIGAVADLRAATVSDVRSFFRAHYVPRGAQLAIVGDFEPAAARALVERWLGGFAGPPPPARPAAPPVPAPARAAALRLADDVAAPLVLLALPSPAALSPGDAECELLAAVLAGGRASRLHRALVEGRGLLQSVEAEQHGLRLGGYVQIRALGRPGGDPAVISRAVEAELGRLLVDPPGEAELARARAALTTERLAAIERHAELAEELNRFEDLLGDAAELPRRFVTRYQEVTPVVLLRAAAALLEARPRVTVQVEPRRGGGR